MFTLNMLKKVIAQTIWHVFWKINETVYYLLVISYWLLSIPTHDAKFYGYTYVK